MDEVREISVMDAEDRFLKQILATVRAKYTKFESTIKKESVGNAVLFVDVENISDSLGFQAIQSAIQLYSPSRRELVFAIRKINLPAIYRDSRDQWVFTRCTHGRNAADHVIQNKIDLLVENPKISCIIVATSDTGFLPCLQNVLICQKFLVTIASEKVKRHFIDSLACRKEADDKWAPIWIPDGVSKNSLS